MIYVLSIAIVAIYIYFQWRYNKFKGQLKYIEYLIHDYNRDNMSRIDSVKNEIKKIIPLKKSEITELKKELTATKKLQSTTNLEIQKIKDTVKSNKDFLIEMVNHLGAHPPETIVKAKKELQDAIKKVQKAQNEIQSDHIQSPLRAIINRLNAIEKTIEKQGGKVDLTGVSRLSRNVIEAQKNGKEI